MVTVFSAPTDHIATTKAVRALKTTSSQEVKVTVQKGAVIIPKQQTLLTATIHKTVQQASTPDKPAHIDETEAEIGVEEDTNYVLTPETYRDWIVNVTFQKYALNGTGRVSFFLCPEDAVPSDFHHYRTSPYYVGSYTIFASPNTEGCSNCQSQLTLPVGGTVHLTNQLIKRQIPLQGDQVVDYLKTNLQWRCANLFEEVPAENVGGLKVLVRSAAYVLPIPVGEVPVRGEWVSSPECTVGKVGGVPEGQY
jgi:hypothetical protein